MASKIVTKIKSFFSKPKPTVKVTESKAPVQGVKVSDMGGSGSGTSVKTTSSGGQVTSQEVRRGTSTVYRSSGGSSSGSLTPQTQQALNLSSQTDRRFLAAQSAQAITGTPGSLSAQLTNKKTPNVSNLATQTRTDVGQVNQKFDIRTDPYIENRQTGSFRESKTGKVIPVYQSVFVDPTGIGVQKEKFLTSEEEKTGKVSFGEDIYSFTNQKELIASDEKVNLPAKRIKSAGLGVYESINQGLKEATTDPLAEFIVKKTKGTSFGGETGLTLDKARQNVLESSDWLTQRGTNKNLVGTGEFLSGFGLGIAEDVRYKPLKSATIYGVSYGAGTLIGGGTALASTVPKVGKGISTGIKVTQFGTGAYFGGQMAYSTERAIYGSENLFEAGKVVGVGAKDLTIAGFGFSKGTNLGRGVTKPVIERIKIESPIRDLKSSEIIGQDVFVSSGDKTLNKVIFEGQKTSQQGFSGSRTTVTQPIRKFFNLKNLYEGVPTDKKGYGRSFNLLKEFGATNYQARGTLRYTAPRIYEQGISKGFINIQGNKALGQISTYTRRPVVDIDKTLGIKTRGGAEVKDVVDFARVGFTKGQKDYAFGLEARNRFTAGKVLKAEVGDINFALSRSTRTEDFNVFTNNLVSTNKGYSIFSASSRQQVFPFRGVASPRTGTKTTLITQNVNLQETSFYGGANQVFSKGSNALKQLPKLDETFSSPVVSQKITTKTTFSEVINLPKQRAISPGVSQKNNVATNEKVLQSDTLKIFSGTQSRQKDLLLGAANSSAFLELLGSRNKSKSAQANKQLQNLKVGQQTKNEQLLQIKNPFGGLNPKPGRSSIVIFPRPFKPIIPPKFDLSLFDYGKRRTGRSKNIKGRYAIDLSSNVLDLKSTSIDKLYSKGAGAFIQRRIISKARPRRKTTSKKPQRKGKGDWWL